MDHLVSIVVPIYNVEKWLDRCIDSIVNQPFQHFELILVNDGSTDSCGTLCDKYARSNNRIRVIHKENGGPSSARNAGIEAASGKYITFIDPDDQITDAYFCRLYQIAENLQCDAVICGYQTVPTQNIVIPNYKLHTLMNGRDLVLSAKNIHSKNDLCFAWRYFYNLEVIKRNNIRFNEEVFIGEDVIFNLEFLLESKRVYAIPDPLYFYTVNNEESQMRMKYKPKLESSLVKQYEVRKKLSKEFNLFKDNHYALDMANYYINNIYSLLLNNLRNSPYDHQARNLSRIINYEMFYDSTKTIGFFYRCSNLKEYIYYLALKFRITPLLIELYKKQGFQNLQLTFKKTGE